MTANANGAQRPPISRSVPPPAWPVAHVAAELGRWVSAERARETGTEAETAGARAELARLRKENAQLRMGAGAQPVKFLECGS